MVPNQLQQLTLFAKEFDTATCTTSGDPGHPLMRCCCRQIASMSNHTHRTGGSGQGPDTNVTGGSGSHQGGRRTPSTGNGYNRTGVLQEFRFNRSRARIVCVDTTIRTACREEAGSQVRYRRHSIRRGNTAPDTHLAFRVKESNGAVLEAAG